VTDSSSPRRLTELQPPDDQWQIERSFEGYRQALATMTVAQLMTEATRLSALIETENRAALTSLISRPLQDYASSLDLIVPRSRPMAPQPSPSARGRAAFQPSSPQPSPVDLLFGSRGRRLASKLVVASSRSAANRR
jgi:hypothetical protein